MKPLKLSRRQIEILLMLMQEAEWCDLTPSQFRAAEQAEIKLQRALSAKC